MYKAFGPLENWIKKIIVNTALDHYRHQTRVEETELFENSGVAVEPLQDYHAQELLRVIHGLPVGFRTVFNLHAIEGYNHKEIAEMLNISEGTSKSQYSRAKVYLAKVLNRNETIATEKP